MELPWFEIVANYPVSPNVYCTSFCSVPALGEHQNAVTSKGAMSHLVGRLPSMDKAVSKDVAIYALSKLQARISTFEESVSYSL